MNHPPIIVPRKEMASSFISYHPAAWRSFFPSDESWSFLALPPLPIVYIHIGEMAEAFDIFQMPSCAALKTL